MGRALVLMATLALAGAACGAGPAADDRVRDAASKTTSAGSARWAIESTFKGGRMHGEGVVDYERTRGAFTYEVAGGPPETTGSYEMRFLDGRMYVKAPPQDTAPGEKNWVSFPLDEMTSLEDAIFGFSRDPAALVESLRFASSDVRKRESEVVRGVETTRYELTIDLQQIVARASPAQRDELELQLEDRAKKTMDCEVWIDEDGLARRVRMLDVAGEEGTVTAEFYDFGVPVEVEAPPAEEVSVADDALQPDDGELYGKDELGGGEGISPLEFPVEVDGDPSLKEADANGDGEVTEDEFLAWMKSRPTDEP